MRKFIVLLIFLLTLLNTAKGQNVVVWDFSTRDGEKNEMANNFANEFEEALAALDSNYDIIERRSMDRLIAVIENERALQDILQMSNATVDNLKQREVEQVVFGEFYDDVESGEASITVTFQELDGKKDIIKSVLIRRGLLSDSRSRREKMDQLVRSIVDVKRPGGNDRVIEADFIFDVQECSLSGRDATCKLLITNNGEDRGLRLYTYYQKNVSTAYDDFNNEVNAARVQLANKINGGRRYAEVMLISGKPTEAVVVFEGLSSQATSLVRVDFSFREMENKTNGTATFRNISL